MYDALLSCITLSHCRKCLQGCVKHPPPLRRDMVVTCLPTLYGIGRFLFSCRWDYAIEERDAEIDELKRRLVEAEHRAKEAANKAAEELRVMNAELQVGVS